MRFAVWNSVQVVNPEHARAGQAGVVFAINPELTDEVAVRFDKDGMVEAVATADLKAL